jgi:hypothetical protein
MTIEETRKLTSTELIKATERDVSTNRKNYDFSDYNAASIILQNLELIYGDLIDNGGL